MPENDNLVELIDEAGNTVRFEHVLTLEHLGKEYAMLAPVEGLDLGEEGGMVVLEIVPGKAGEEDTYQGVEDELLLEALYQKYLEEVEFEEE